MLCSISIHLQSIQMDTLLKLNQVCIWMYLNINIIFYI